MKRAFEEMQKKLPVWCLENKLSDCDISAMADGTFKPDILCAEILCEPKADAKYPAVMAASILAKNARDRFMAEMDKLYPEYGYAKHKGYPTAAHIQICRRIGASPIQRHSFTY